MAKTTSRKLLSYVEASELVSEFPAKDATAKKGVDEVNERQQDIMGVGVVNVTAWEFTPSINETTAELGFTGEVPESTCWLPDPVKTAEGALMPSITPKSKPAGEVSPVKPAEGKYVCINYELAPTTWNGEATVHLHGGTEQTTEAAAYLNGATATSGRMIIKQAVIKNTGGKYKIEGTRDRRPFANGYILQTGLAVEEETEAERLITNWKWRVENHANSVLHIDLSAMAQVTSGTGEGGVQLKVFYGASEGKHYMFKTASKTVVPAFGQYFLTIGESSALIELYIFGAASTKFRLLAGNENAIVTFRENFKSGGGRYNGHE